VSLDELADMDSDEERRERQLKMQALLESSRII
jgi:hypothetical protein